MSATIERAPAENKGPVFTQDWVKNHTQTWREHLGHLAGIPGALGLEIGVYEGRSALWWLENILTGVGSRLVGIEPWREKIEPNLTRFKAVGFGPDRFHVHYGTAQQVFFEKRWTGDQFDFAYVDGGKDADVVLQNSVLAWLALKPGGILVWDDYEWTWREGVVSPQCDRPPKIGIDAFLAATENRLTELHRGWQIIIRKNEA